MAPAELSMIAITTPSQVPAWGVISPSNLTYLREIDYVQPTKYFQTGALY